MSGLTVLIMAAGEGTRMRSTLPKVLHEVCGRPMVVWPVAAALEAGAGRVAVIVSPERDLAEALPEGVETVVQPQPDGTGGAVRAALDLIRESETVVVLNGDHPLVGSQVIRELLAAHHAAGAAATVMSVEREDAAGLGRIVRDDAGGFERIIETKHTEGLSTEVLAIREVNTNQFAFDAHALAEVLPDLSADNPAREYYLGDVLPLIRAAGGHVIAHKTDDLVVNIGVNNRAELARVTAIARRRINEVHMLAGVTITDPAATWIDVGVEIGADTLIEPGCTLRGATRVGGGSVVGPHATLLDATVGEQVAIRHSVLDRCEIGHGCTIGPFAYVRPGTRLAEGVKAGTFVEIKNSEVGAGAKVPHLSYVGDADIGPGANLGASTITANYDGRTKHRTKIGERARISVHTSLVAPVAIGDDAYTGAGAVIRKDVPRGALGVSQGKQRNIEGYADRTGAAGEDDAGDSSGGSE